MKRTVLLLTAGIAGASGFLQGQTPSDQKPPAFEVASVKENTNITDVPTGRLAPDGGFTATRLPPLFCILLAFQLLPDQIVGAPSWIGTTYYDIQAKPAAAVTRRELFAMLQALLQDRFHLQFHRESRELPIYALVRVRPDGLGPRFRQSVTDCVKESPKCDYAGGVSAHIQTEAISMDILTALLSNATGRVVVDRTGLNGGFAIDLEWSPDQSATDRPSIFTAVQEQLGLKLESTKGPVDVLVIDHVEKPTPD